MQRYQFLNAYNIAFMRYLNNILFSAKMDWGKWSFFQHYKKVTYTWNMKKSFKSHNLHSLGNNF